MAQTPRSRLPVARSRPSDRNGISHGSLPYLNRVTILQIILLCITITREESSEHTIRGYIAGGQKEAGTGHSFGTRRWASATLSFCRSRFFHRGLGRFEIDPTRAPVVPGGGGARKIRRPDQSSRKGKSGGCRVLYAFLPVHGIVLLIAAWPKSEREDLEPDDYTGIGKIISRIQKRLDQGSSM
jgi:hypothetical protein